MSTARSRVRSRAWLRVLVLLLALLVPGAHAQAHALPVAAGVVGEVAEYDVLDTAVRPPARADRRSTVRLRPGPVPQPAPGVPACPARSVPPRAPYVPYILRTVVLRC
ncbi:MULTISPECIES: hypothetical protein [unclassified Streptomyces]|uniref:hypothetical protein n=1 Tax=unclassified Streptomyces TaxID=2593676 RepID=UPI0027E366FC|nr:MULTISPECIES: hypothetical protein [unclassified Streptomyces]